MRRLRSVGGGSFIIMIVGMHARTRAEAALAEHVTCVTVSRECA
jgi:hypothetical protein